MDALKSPADTQARYGGSDSQYTNGASYANGDDEYEFERNPELEAYLKSVKDEERRIERDRILGSSALDGFHYDDHAIIADTVDSGGSGGENNASDAVSVYTDRLVQQHDQYREQLESIEPQIAMRSLTRWMKTDFGNRSIQSCTGAWERFLKRKPKLEHLVCITTRTKIKCLTLAVLDLKRNKNVRKTMSFWIWGLLCGLPPKTELDAGDIDALRMLARRAAWVLLGYGEWAAATEQLWEQSGGLVDEIDEDSPNEPTGQDEAAAHQQEVEHHNTSSEMDMSGSEMDISSGIDEDEIVERKTLSNENEQHSTVAEPVRNEEATTQQDPDANSAQRMEDDETSNNVGGSGLNHTDTYNPSLVRAPDATTKFTLDFILVIVGRVYGQRDLLEHRKPFW